MTRADATAINPHFTLIAAGYAGSERARFGGIFAMRTWLYVSVSTVTTKQLTNADRCDRCGAQAFVRVVLNSGELLFCAHHGRKHADAFREVAVEIHDESDKLHATT